MIRYYQIRSPLSHTSEESTARYIASLQTALGEELCGVGLEKYLSAKFALLYVATGGSEGYFLQIFDQLKRKRCYILTSGDANSLAASMEILSYLRKHGAEGEILHGSIHQVAKQIRNLRNACRGLDFLNGKRLGCIGKPSDWLIASDYSPDVVKDRLNLGFVSIGMEELIAEIEKNSYEDNEYTLQLKNKAFACDEVEKALCIYGAFKRLVDRYGLCGVSVRCFDLLDSVKSTGCLGLSLLNSIGVYGGCEGDMPTLLSMALLGSATGEPVFMCNPSRFDTDTGSAVFAHCTVPVTMLRDFSLNTHFESGIGVAVQGSFDIGDCTLFKCEGDLSRFYVQEGRILDMPFSDTLCRTQIKVELNDFSYFLTRPMNNHHVICKGRHAAEIEALFRILK